MIMKQLLAEEHVSVRKLPINLNSADLGLFEHELKRAIPAINLLSLNDISVNPDGILYRGARILSESFHLPYFHDVSGARAMAKAAGRKSLLKFLAGNCLLRRGKKFDGEAIWCSDDWSHMYFHWMTDTLPRLMAIHGRMGNATLLLPGAYQKKEYVTASLRPFSVQGVNFVNETCRCGNLTIPTHAAPTGNYNVGLTRDLRSLYTDFFQNVPGDRDYGDRIYVSRCKAGKRRITNEKECFAVLEEYGFNTVYFEDHPFEQQVKIALKARYLVSNHGAGLTNILFMKSGCSVLELRLKGDSHNNCYFVLASALDLKYYYQLCDSTTIAVASHTADLTVDCGLLRENLENMLLTE